MLYFLKKLIPASLFRFLQPYYHFLLAYAGAARYMFPSKKLIVVGVTGTKGKSSVIEIINAILEEAGNTTAVLNTIRFKIGNKTWSNKFKMTMPGRFFIQKFLRSAVIAGCTHIVLEMTSEGVKQFRHKCIELDALIFTNIAAEHIEAHGSYEHYVKAKLQLAKELEKAGEAANSLIFLRESFPLFLRDVQEQFEKTLPLLLLLLKYRDVPNQLLASQVCDNPLTPFLWSHF